MPRAESSSFLCEGCRSVMCEDCASIADEYWQIDQARKVVMMHMEEKLESAKAELALWKRRAEMYHEVSMAGIPDIISAWMEKNFDRLLRQVN